MREIAEFLNVFSHGFSSFLDCREELIHGHLSVILVESRKELSFWVNSKIDGAVGKASELIKGYPLKGTDEYSGHDSIIVYRVVGLRPEVIDVLIW